MTGGEVFQGFERMRSTLLLKGEKGGDESGFISEN
jgi:hypothetical protein